MPKFKPSILLIFCLFWADKLLAAPTQFNIKLGMSVALSGPASEIGRQLALGSQIYFEQLNKNGGVHGALVELDVKDDRYEPSHTVNNTRYFIYEKKVHALFGYMGTPTTSAVKSMLEHAQTPLLMPYTGAEFLRKKPKFKVFNLRASYLDEAKEQINHLVDELGHSKIALLIQADEFGITLQKSLTTALRMKGLEPQAIGRFRRNTNEVEKALNQILQSEATAVAMVGTYEPLAEFIRLSQQHKKQLAFTTVSFASSEDLLSKLSHPSQLMITEVVPNPASCKGNICDNFRALLNAQSQPLTHAIFEGYLNALVFSRAAKMCPLPFNNNCVLKALQNVINQDLELRHLFKISPTQKKLPIFRSYHT
ncbi:ABC transporter substrate-binding protein [Pseudoalteromonas phenolica]|uniref:ABC transporter substrate-binding protein n=1 Tax=Pseudoalteromonas phenolica TaxID=161398 RepID=UPI00110AE446|nr:ABC transporter substrate-binding protein [Pseudoalteromonas phenolica]TMO53308.1 ABC transporter substrate-binding protein [Pseudoalteromonas phenolica]